MDNLKELLSNNLPAVPKEIIPSLAFGLIIIAIILILIFFVMCVVYINSQNKPNNSKVVPVKPLTRDDVIKNKNSEVNKNITNNETSLDSDAKCEKLPLISGRLGEILGLLGFLNIGPITRAFFQAVEAVRNSTFDLKWRYKLPCFMIIGPKGSGKTTLLNNLNCEHIDSDKSQSIWKLFKEAAIFEFPSVSVNEDKSKFWSFVSELFVFIRPRRPLDGLIITVPVDMLLSEHSNIEKQSREMFDRIFKFQRDINFKLPIYFIVTKTDKIYGFQEFVQLLKPSTKQQIFGWSCPYALDIAFTPNWINEIFDTINSGIRKAIFYFSRKRTIGPSLEKAIVFDDYFQRIKKPLTDYLLTMFRTHNPMDGMILRGVYFVGRQKEEEISSNGLVQLSALTPGFNVDASLNHLHTDDLCFVQDLFKDKIFQEYNLAHPIIKDSGGMSKQEYRNKIIFAGSIVAFSVGWIWGNGNIRTNIQNYCQTMQAIKSNLLKIKYLEDNMNSSEDQILINNQASLLLQNMPVVKTGDFFSIFVPQSWLFTLKHSVQETMELVFDSVVVKAMYIDLNFNTKNILLKSQTTSTKERNNQQDIFDVQNFDSFKELIEFSKNIKDLTQISYEYNSMRNLENSGNVSEITQSLFKNKFEIVEKMKKHIPNRRVMPPQFNINDFQSNIESSLQNIFNNFIQDTLDTTVEKVLHNVSSDLTRLYEVGSNSQINYTVQDLAKLYNKLELVEDIFNNKNFAWIKESEFCPTPEYKVTLDNLQSTEVISSKCIKDLVHFANVSFNKYKNALGEYKSTLSGTLIENLAPSQGFQLTKQELKIILDLPFICVVPNGNFSKELPTDKMLIWDIKRLKELSDHIDKYYEFAGTVPDTMRSQYFDLYKTVVKKCFYPTIKAILGNAQILDDIPLGNSKILFENSYRKQANNILNASLAIPKIIKILDELIAEENLQDFGFSDLIINQYLGLLEKIDAMFNTEKPYSTNQAMFDNWNGTGNPSFMNMNNQASVQQYLKSQFERMKFLAKDLASPIVDLLTIPIIFEKITDKQLINKWKEIINSIDEYEKNKPGNSIAALENFVTDNLQKVSLNNIDTQGEIKDFSKNNGDYFLEKRSDVAKSLINRVDVVKYDQAAEIYQNVRDIFNKKLAGKFPFGNSQDEVSIDDLESYLKAFKTIDANVISTLKKNQSEKNIGSEVFDFINEMNKLSTFFELWIAQSKSSDPNTCPIAFNILLRPYPNLEIMTSSVIDRVFSINKISIPDGQNGNYFIGNQIIVMFGWVASAEEKPDNSKIVGNLQIEDNLAAFSYKGNWSMFRFIEEHKLNQGVEQPDGIILQFNIPIASTIDGSSLDAAKMVYKLTPLQRDGDKFKPLTWPSSFPTSCPDLHTVNSGANNKLDVDVSFDD